MIECTVSVTDVQDFEKMYLADVATEAELNSDVFGVPMRIDHVGEFQYQALFIARKLIRKSSSYRKRQVFLLFVMVLIRQMKPC